MNYNLSVVDDERFNDLFEQVFNEFCIRTHNKNVEAGWWTDITTGERKDRNMGEMLMLVVTEIAEAMESERKDLMDDKLPQYKGLPVELGDAIIRMGDIAGSRSYPLGTMIVAKQAYNATREDHRIENRLKENGKKS